jgi:hypothetical protein
MCSTVGFHSRFDPPLVVGQLLKFRFISILSALSKVNALAQLLLHPLGPSLSPVPQRLVSHVMSLCGILNPLLHAYGRRLTPGGFSGSIDWVKLKPTRKGAASFLDATFVIDGQGSSRQIWAMEGPLLKPLEQPPVAPPRKTVAV